MECWIYQELRQCFHAKKLLCWLLRFIEFAFPPTEPCPGILLPSPHWQYYWHASHIVHRSCYRNTLTKISAHFSLVLFSQELLALQKPYIQAHCSQNNDLEASHVALPPKKNREKFGETYWYFMASTDLVWFGMLCANVAWWYAVQALHLNSVVHVNINVAWVLQVGIVVVKWCSATATYHKHKELLLSHIVPILQGTSKSKLTLLHRRQSNFLQKWTGRNRFC